MVDLKSLKADFKLSCDGDTWGETMQWWFTIADEIYFNRDFPVPADWHFRPSPLGPSNEPGEWPVDIVEAAGDDELLAFGNLLNRYARLLKRAGKDY